MNTTQLTEPRGDDWPFKTKIDRQIDDRSRVARLIFNPQTQNSKITHISIYV